MRQPKASGKRVRRERDGLAQRVLRFMERQRMAAPGDRVGVAVSGGADSVALLLLLEELREPLGLLLSVLHFNHKLRGAESDADESFVRELAAARGFECILGAEDVARQAREEGGNLEEVGRHMRYAFFDHAVKSGRVTRVAVAHTADDQAETVLAHLLRGTGPAGLGAIYPVAGAVVRPLLETRRGELREYLGKKKQAWREDLSNLDTRRTRARIREKLLPLLEREFQPAVVEQLVRLAGLAREDETFWHVLVEDRYRALVQHETPAPSIGVADLLDPLHLPGEPREAMAAFTKRLIRRLVEAVKGDRRQLTAEHVAQVVRLAADGTSGQRTDLPGGIEVVREFDRLVFLRREPAADKTQGAVAQPSRGPYEYKVELDTSGTTALRVAEIASYFHLKVIDWPSRASDTKSAGAVLDKDLLRAPLVLRSWRPGDCFRPEGRLRTRKLKRLLLEKRVSRRERAGWPVLTSAGALAWARGLPVAAEFAPRRGTRAGLVIIEEPL
ncbi:MAG TPA: tRNA lysidine(34) synthetase TilS [Candidatus Acidoferrales bacterium]|nr:tRNA lysidine(34) synthetase TilS [Candidatus Acidoferrales bacterium]